MQTLFAAFVSYCVGLCRGLARGWSRFWFAPSAPTTLGMMRLCTGLILLHVHLTTFHQLLDFVGPNAWVDDQAVREIHAFPETVRARIARGELQLDPSITPEELIERNTWRRLSVYELPFLREPAAIYAVHTVFVLSMFCFAVGLFTRPAALLAWVGHLSYIQRGYTIWFGMDTMLLFITFYLMFSPCGWALSVDRLLARWRAARGSANGLGEAPSPVHWSATTLTRMVQVHMSIVYFCAGVAKLQGPTWWNGTATWMTMNTAEFALVDMSWLGDTPLWVWNGVTTFTTYATLAFEIAFPFLIWLPFWRPIFLFGAVALHMGIGFFMGLVAFGNIMLTGCMSFVTPQGMEWFLAALFGGPKEQRFRFSRHDPTARRQAALLKALDAFGRIDFVEAAGDGGAGGVLEQPDGSTRTGKAIVPALLRRLPTLWLTWPLVLVLFPGSAGAGEAPRPSALLKGQEQTARK